LIPLQPPVAIAVPAPQPLSQPAPQPPSCSYSIADVLYSDAMGGDVQNIAGLAEFIGLSAKLDGVYTSEPYTIFVPTDAAVYSSGIDWETLVSQDPSTIEKILNNHIIPGQSLQVADFSIGSTYPTWNEGQLLKLDAPLDPILEGPITVCNTVIHKVSVVIVPSFVGPLPMTASTASSAATGSQQAAAGTSSQTGGVSVDVTDVSIGDNSFGSSSASAGGNSFDSTSGSWNGNSWDSSSWDFGGFSGSFKNVNWG
jgi:hypothetical protein